MGIIEKESPVTKNRSSSSTENFWFQQITDQNVIDLNGYADFMLSMVSRTFALNIRILPKKLKHEILLAYLFCRIADTIEDDKMLESEAKVFLLDQYQLLFDQNDNWSESIERFVHQLPVSWKSERNWDQLLTWHCKWIFSLFFKLHPASRNAISHWVKEMCEGMKLFARHETDKESKNVIIADIKDLDRYCYYVAGTVGNMLCDLFNLHSKFISAHLYDELKRYAVSFGLGLQLTNILKDVYSDIDRNIMFIPMAMLKEQGLTKDSFFDLSNRERSNIILQQLITKATSHLADALRYTLLLPRREPGIRLFCLWPLFMAMDTLVLLAQELHSSSDKKVLKISKQQVKTIIRQTNCIFWSNHLLQMLFNKKQRLLQHLLSR
ncbi:MAG: squalene/phytoene synthase family protein [Fibrobacteria bacterium]|nr:squalene/phytoene synthase family protein [Fibrobacteria bacterium]